MRYKVLVRERDRLKEAGRPEPEVDAEIEKLIAQFPSLVETKTSVSEATAQMLKFAELMQDETGSSSAPSSSTVPTAAPPPAKPIEAVPPNPVPATPSSNVVAPAGGSDAPTTSTSASLPSASTASAGEPEPRPSKNDNSKSFGRAGLILQVIAVTLRMYLDITSRPSFPQKEQGKVLLLAVGAAWLHAYHVDPCGLLGRLVDPTLIVLGLHLQCCIGGYATATTKSRRSFPERFIVYCLRDFLPSLASAFVLYSLAAMSLSFFFDASMTYICRR